VVAPGLEEFEDRGLSSFEDRRRSQSHYAEEGVGGTMRVCQAVAIRDDRAAGMIAAAIARTRDAGSARIELQIGEQPLPWGFDQPIRVARHPMRGFARWFVQLQAAAKATEGVIDFRGRRYMLFGPYAQVYVNGELRGGAPGRSLSSLTRDKNRPVVPLWLLDLLDGMHDAGENGTEMLRGVSCRHLTPDLDARHASATLPSHWSADPDVLRPEVWVGADGYIHRVQVHAMDRAQALELWDFGVPLDHLDWTRLPARQSAEPD